MPPIRPEGKPRVSIGEPSSNHPTAATRPWWVGRRIRRKPYPSAGSIGSSIAFPPYTGVMV